MFDWYSSEDGQRIMHYIHKQNKAEATSLNNDSAQFMFLSILGNLPSYLLIGFYTSGKIPEQIRSSLFNQKRTYFRKTHFCSRSIALLIKCS